MRGRAKVLGALGAILVAANFTKGLVAMFTAMILLSTLASLIPYAFCTMADALLSIKERRLKPGTALGGALALSGLAFVYALIATAGAGQETVFWGFLTLLAGIPFYVLTKWRLPQDNDRTDASLEPGEGARELR